MISFTIGGASRLKILMVSHYFESHGAGIELVAGRLVRELCRLGQDVKWISSNSSPPPKNFELDRRAIAIPTLNTTEQLFGIPFPLPGPVGIWRIRREVAHADIVVLHDALYPVCVAAFTFARLSATPVLLVQHVGAVPYRNPLFRWLMILANRFFARPMLARADRVGFISEITARYFSGVRFRSSPAVVFNGVDTTVFRPAALNQKTGIRARLSLDADRPMSLFVGRFVEKKGIHILERMARQRPKIQWVFAGWGRLDPGNWGLPNVIVFRHLTGADLVHLYQASDVFVLPSIGEGFPLVIQEALACGLPVVTSAGNTGADAAAVPFLYAVPLDPSDLVSTASAFCDAIDRLLANRGDDLDLPRQRFEFVSNRYSWSASAAKYLHLAQAAVRDAKQLTAPKSRES